MASCDIMCHSDPQGEKTQSTLYMTKTGSERPPGPSAVSLLFFFLLAGHVCPASSQSPDYRIIFGDNWVRAERIVEENMNWMQEESDLMGISYTEAVAVVFPELIRYSALRDRIEITLLKALYINLGEDYANFSVGPFQMKPSFAEQLHRELSVRSIRKVRVQARDGMEYRARVVDDLEDIRSQFVYLMAFIKYCQARYKDELKEETHRVRFLASAYNCGFDSGAERISDMMERKFFSTGFFENEYFSYSDISLFWYLSHQKRKE